MAGLDLIHFPVIIFSDISRNGSELSLLELFVLLCFGICFFQHSFIEEQLLYRQ